MTIEEKILKILKSNSKMARYSAFVVLPEEIPIESFLTVERIAEASGSPGIRSGSVAIQSWASSHGTEQEAAELNELIVAALLSADSAEVPDITLDSAIPFNSLNYNRYRYQAIFDLTYYTEV